MPPQSEMCRAIGLLFRPGVVISMIVVGCATTGTGHPGSVAPSARKTYVAAVVSIPVEEMSTNANTGEEAGVCETPVAVEKANCPAVYEKRAWVADDGSGAACRLSVCGQEKVWRRIGSAWHDSTFRLR